MCSSLLLRIGGRLLDNKSITNAAVDELKLATGKDAYAVIKASEVMIGKWCAAEQVVE
jgi:molybdopterin-binding protein